MHVLVDDTNHLSQPDGTAVGATQTQEPGSHQARAVTHNPRPATGIIVPLHFSGQRIVKRTAE